MNLKYIDVAFGARAVTEVKPRYKYDYGQVLRFVDLDLPEAYEVHLSNTNDVGTAKRAIGDAEGCEIYDEYFVNGDTIYAWLFLNDAESGRTVKKVIIPLREKPRPENSEPTPVQIDIVDIAISKLNQAVAETEENVRITSEYATDAETAKDAAEAARDASQTSAGESAASAGQAAQSATNAAQSATSAGQSATNAAGSASTANTKAGEAATSAGNAAGSAATASNAANTATEKASEASQSATNAQAAAQSVSTQSKQIDVNKGNTKGTNLLYNGQPHLSHAFNQGSENIGWTKSVTSGVNVEWVGDEYIHMRAYSWSISATDNKICQLNKYYKLNGEVYASKHGDEIADFVDGADGVISFEVKANNTVKITSTLLVSFNDDTPTIRTFESEQTISNDGEWHSFVVADTVPNNWQTLVRQANVKNARMSVDIYTTTSTDISLGDLNVYVRNVKFEYGTNATPFSYSQADNTYLLNTNMQEHSVLSDDLKKLKTATKGKNLLINSKPIISNSHGTSEVSGWISNVARTGSYVDWMGGEYIHVHVPIENITNNYEMVAQVSKAFMSNGQYIHDRGEEISEFIGGENAVLQFEVSSNKKMAIICALLVTFNDGTSDIVRFNGNPQEVFSDGEYRLCVVSDSIPSDWYSVIRQSNVVNAELTLGIFTYSATDASAEDLELYIRNVKFEYGTSPTTFTYSDADQTYLLEHQNSSTGYDLVATFDDMGDPIYEIKVGDFSTAFAKLSSGMPLSILITRSEDSGFTSPMPYDNYRIVNGSIYITAYDVFGSRRIIWDSTGLYMEVL